MTYEISTSISLNRHTPIRLNFRSEFAHKIEFPPAAPSEHEKIFRNAVKGGAISELSIRSAILLHSCRFVHRDLMLLEPLANSDAKSLDAEITMRVVASSRLPALIIAAP